MVSKILITGSSGFIGTHLLDSLLEKGHQVLGLDKEFPRKSSHEGFYVKCNILDFENLSRVLHEYSTDYVFHLAARIDLDEKYNLQGYESNIRGVKNLVDAIQLTSSVKRCIYTSSQLVCKVGHVPKDEYEYVPNTLYGESKVLTEKIVRENDGGGVEWCIVRPTTVWGPGMSLHYQRFLKMIYKGRYFHVGNSLLYKSYSYVGNIVYQYQKLIEAPSELINKKTFYLADYEPISLRKWTDLIQTEMRVKPIVTYPEFLVRLLASLGDALQSLGITNLPFNSFRLNNILTEYVFDLSETERVCGDLPYSVEKGVKELVLWLDSEGIFS